MSTYDYVQKFISKYPLTIGWRLRKNSAIIDKHLNPDEVIRYAFVAQKNDRFYTIINTAIIVLTNKRLLIGRDRVVVGYFLDSVTPDLFNDLKVKSGIIWGKVEIDTVKEFITLTNIDKRALPEVETEISAFMLEKKQKRNSQETD